MKDEKTFLQEGMQKLLDTTGNAHIICCLADEEGKMTVVGRGNEGAIKQMVTALFLKEVLQVDEEDTEVENPFDLIASALKH